MANGTRLCLKLEAELGPIYQVLGLKKYKTKGLQGPTGFHQGGSRWSLKPGMGPLGGQSLLKEVDHWELGFRYSEPRFQPWSLLSGPLRHEQAV